jgi:NAD(P)-dependent dehydrogenase (short-subunit alcohol dehydrogenase family)
MFIPLDTESSPLARSPVMFTAKTVLITGATSGIGRATALHLARLGHRVFATGRRLDELAKVKAEAGSAALETLALDVTSAASIAAAVAEIDARTQGRGLDALVNNAGFGVLGPTSEIGDDEMRRQYETNVFGLMNVTRAFLPRMRARGAGRIINVSSVGGRITLPYFGVYNSTKYAVESLSDALRYELRPFGIDVVMIEPGVIRTQFEATAAGNFERFANTAYAAAVEKYGELSKMADRFASEPIVIARAIARAVAATRPKARYVAPRSTNVVLWLSAVLPTRVWDWMMRKSAFLSPRHLRVTSRPGTAATTAPGAGATTAKGEPPTAGSATAHGQPPAAPRIATN